MIAKSILVIANLVFKIPLKWFIVSVVLMGIIYNIKMVYVYHVLPYFQMLKLVVLKLLLMIHGNMM